MTPDSDEHLVRYLLGALPQAEAERLDERSITDDAFALRLREIENDLVDRYARGERLDIFERACRTSSHLREKVHFAQALQALTTRSESGETRGTPGAKASRVAWWSLAAAALLLLATASYLGLRSTRLQGELGQVEARRTEVERQNADLQHKLAQLGATPATQPSTVAAIFLLRPPRRGLGDDTATIAIPRGTPEIRFRLLIESDEYASFWAGLRDPATTRVVWRSADLEAEAAGSDRIVTFTVPVSSLEPRRYSVELSGAAGGRLPELVAHYPIRVVLE
jgi:hypothetical protein